MIGELVEASFAPRQGLDMPIEVDVIGPLTVAVIANPTLVGVFAGAPLHQRGFPDPRVVIVLLDAAIFGVIRRVEGLRVALREHDDVRVGQGAEGGLISETNQGALQRVTGGLVGEDGVQHVTFDAKLGGLCRWW